MTTLPNADRIRLHGLLRAAAEPWLEVPVEPIVVGWYQYRTKQTDSAQFGMFRLQYGARAWSTGGHSFGASARPIAPSYQAQFEQQAITLREAGWDRLSASLLRPGELPKNESARPNVEMFLLIDSLSCHFGVRSKVSGQEAYFLVNELGLEPDPSARKVWFDAWPAQHCPPVFRPTHMPNNPNRQNPAEVARHVRWWYQTPLMLPDEAGERLGALLKVLFKRLARLGRSVAIATSPHRFNDACGDDNWLAAFVDGSTWENGVYFKSSAKTLENSPRVLHEAMGLLQEVLTSGVRQRLAEYLGSMSAWPDTLILSSDERGHLIALSRSTDNGGPVYRVDPDSGLPSLVGVAPRLDWRFAECSSPARREGAEASRDEVVQFVPLSEWIEKLGSDDDASRDWPELNHI